MKYTKKVYMKIVSLTLSVVMLCGVFPASAMASDVIDAPLNGVTGSGWDDFGGSPDEHEEGIISIPETESSDEADPEIGDNADDVGDADNENQETGDDAQETGDNAQETDEIETDMAEKATKEEMQEEATESETVAATTPTQVSLGASVVAIDLPSDVLADLIAFMENAEVAINTPPRRLLLRAGVGDTGTITWEWGEPADFSAGGYYVSNIPSITLSTTRPSEGRRSVRSLARIRLWEEITRRQHIATIPFSNCSSPTSRGKRARWASSSRSGLSQTRPRSHPIRKRKRLFLLRAVSARTDTPCCGGRRLDPTSRFLRWKK
jgi:hypothetical protein